MILDCIRRWGSSRKSLGNVESPFINISLGFIETKKAVVDTIHE